MKQQQKKKSTLVFYCTSFSIIMFKVLHQSRDSEQQAVQSSTEDTHKSPIDNQSSADLSTTPFTMIRAWLIFLQQRKALYQVPEGHVTTFLSRGIDMLFISPFSTSRGKYFSGRLSTDGAMDASRLYEYDDNRKNLPLCSSLHAPNCCIEFILS